MALPFYRKYMSDFKGLKFSEGKHKTCKNQNFVYKIKAFYMIK